MAGGNSTFYLGLASLAYSDGERRTAGEAMGKGGETKTESGRWAERFLSMGKNGRLEMSETDIRRAAGSGSGNKT